MIEIFGSIQFFEVSCDVYIWYKHGYIFFDLSFKNGILCRYSLFTGDVFGNGSIIVDLVHVLEANYLPRRVIEL